MTGLAPEVSVMVIALGLVLALVCYLVTNLSPGGMITPGWLALAFIVQPLLALVIAAVIAATYLTCQLLRRAVILYGKRLFATVVLVAVFFQLTAFLFLMQGTSTFYDATTLGFIVPGLVTYQLIRQPAIATITATATVTMVAYCVMLAGILLRFVPVEQQVAASGIAASPAAPFSSLQLVLSVVAILLLLVLVGAQTRTVRHAASAAPFVRRGAESIAGLGRFLLGGARLATQAGSAYLVRVERRFRGIERSSRNVLVARTGEYRDPLLLVACIAAGFGVHFGFGGSQGLDVSGHDPRSRLPSAETAAGSTLVPFDAVKSPVRRGSDDAPRRSGQRTGRAHRKRGGGGSGAAVPSVSTTPAVSSPSSIAADSNAAAPSPPALDRTPPARAQSKRLPGSFDSRGPNPPGFDDSG